MIRDVAGSQGEHLQMVSDSGCTGAIMDQAIPAEDSLPVAMKGSSEETSVGGGGQICMEGATFLMPYTAGSPYQYQEISGMVAPKIVTPPDRISIMAQMDQLFREYLEHCEQKKEEPSTF